jgi:vancomycin resistance protein VanW
MARKLFCEINSFTYNISLIKERIKRYLNWFFGGKRYSNKFLSEPLPFVAYQHSSLIMRTLGDVGMRLQNNKAANLKLAAPRINGILIKPGETFSFWKLVGNCTRRKGYMEGLVIKSQKVDRGIGGGMCQFTNLIHWMVLHSPLDITEHHHHNQIDMFPDFNRQIPFGSGTSICYNHIDYQFTNNTDNIFQILVYTTDAHLVGELRCQKQLDKAYHIVEKNSCFTVEDGVYYRNNEIYRKVIDKSTSSILNEELIVKNHSKVLYDSRYIPVDKLA